MGGKEVGPGLVRGDAATTASGYLTHLFGDEAVRVIEADADRPFFLSLHFTAPHWPWEGPGDGEITKTIDSSFDYERGNLARYREMVEAMDDDVAKVLAALDRTGKTDNTIVVFTSDNGGERFSDTWPLIGVKGEVLEGGVRVPIMMKWPGHIPAGSRSEQVMASFDFLPTFVAMAGGSVEKAGDFDGKDLSPQLLGTEAPVERTLFWRIKANEQAAVRKGDWKYVRIAGKQHLFNLAEDERERADRTKVNPEKLAELRQLWDGWNREMVPYRVDGFSQDARDFFTDRY